MEYFNILNLHKEPFSNSPEPELFFLSGQHQRCLQRMELAVRLRRGLNVVIGEIGTGKTTLCRQLILRLASSDEDNMIQTHLLLDPSFSSPLEFLLAVAKVFGLTETSGEQSEWQLKERIKNYLFTCGVEAGRIVVLIVDEGQKLPPFCVEILREFLNYETTNSKLLQIIIFAQEEFRQILRRHANFSDRVNELYHLGPLSFKETRQMIRFRLARACRDGAPPPLFSLSGLLAIHMATGGYPRKIITLCHQVILALIIKNQTKVDWFVARACVKRVASGRKRAIQWKWPAGAMAALVFVVASLLLFQQMAWQYQPLLLSLNKRISRQTQTNRVLAPPPGIVSQTQSTPQAAIAESKDRLISPGAVEVPSNLGSLTVKKGENVLRILHAVYGDVNRNQFQSVIQANPHIHDVNHVKDREIITLPVLSMMKRLPVSMPYWIRIAEDKDLEGAYVFLKSYPRYYPPIRLLPYWNRRQGLTFALVLNNGFEDKASAEEMMASLPRVLTSEARVITWEQGTVFFKKTLME